MESEDEYIRDLEARSLNSHLVIRDVRRRSIALDFHSSATSQPQHGTFGHYSETQDVSFFMLTLQAAMILDPPVRGSISVTNEKKNTLDLTRGMYLVDAIMMTSKLTRHQNKKR